MEFLSSVDAIRRALVVGKASDSSSSPIQDRRRQARSSSDQTSTSVTSVWTPRQDLAETQSENLQRGTVLERRRERRRSRSAHPVVAAKRKSAAWPCL